MKLASLNNGTRDGRLLVVSRDLKRAILAPAPDMTLISVIEAGIVRHRVCCPSINFCAQMMPENSLLRSWTFHACSSLHLCRAPRSGWMHLRSTATET